VREHKNNHALYLKDIGRKIAKGGRELKRPKTLFGALLALALALSLVVAVPAYAADVGLTKGVTPATPNEYQLGETIHYTMSIVNVSNVTGANENITVTAVWDVLPDGSTVYPTGPSLPYTLTPGQSQTYTYDWVANRKGTVVNTFYASGYQVSTFNDPFSEEIEKSSVVIGREVGGTASLVNKVGLVAPWAVLLACAGIVALVIFRRRRQA
jgi:uncharacterized repeat protein (TIGR01451 family)